VLDPVRFALGCETATRTASRGRSVQSWILLCESRVVGVVAFGGKGQPRLRGYLGDHAELSMLSLFSFGGADEESR
jgi:hypothetical protein